MNQERRNAEDRLYSRCAEILGIPHEHRPWTGRGPNRWNNRHAGNGRFPGAGTIRMFSPNAIHVSLRAPVAINHWCRSEDEVYEVLAASLPVRVIDCPVRSG